MGVNPSKIEKYSRARRTSPEKSELRNDSWTVKSANLVDRFGRSPRGQQWYGGIAVRAEFFHRNDASSRLGDSDARRVAVFFPTNSRSWPGDSHCEYNSDLPWFHSLERIAQE